MDKLADSRKFYRFLEIVPGFLAWTTLILPIALAPFQPIAVAYFILIFNLFWLGKAVNLSRYLIVGFLRLKKNMSVDWVKRCENTQDLGGLKEILENEERNGENKLEIEKVNTLMHANIKVPDWKEIYHVVIIAIYTEGLDIIRPTIQAIKDSNFSNDKIMIVLACEERAPEASRYAEIAKKEFEKDFKYFDYTVHPKDLPNEVMGKGPNITYAGRKLKKYLDEFENIPYENILVTNLDADHIVHKEYFGRSTFCYVLDMKDKKKTYQPVPLLFNNIWDTPAPNRIAAVGSSFWQIVEAMRPYRLKTFASHTQSFQTLVDTDFWAIHSIVEDGHQFWRTYFTYNGEHEMVPLIIPIYQDAVLAETYWKTFKNQYLQRQRWAWGTSDFPFIVVNFMKQKKIGAFEKFIQTFRHFGGLYSWATASFLLAGAWIPLLFNNSFQDTVLAHNVTAYGVFILRLAWFGIFFNVWIYLSLLPPKPKKYGILRQLSMITQWLLSPFVAIFLSSLPALDSQTRLMLGKYLEFWTTPKIRKA